MKVAIQQGNKYDQVFVAGSNQGGITQHVNYVTANGPIGNFRLIDSVGFDDVDRHDSVNWGNWINETLSLDFNFEEEGATAFIFSWMVDKSGRI